jgi:RHS repeat-associated protein
MSQAAAQAAPQVSAAAAPPGAANVAAWGSDDFNELGDLATGDGNGPSSPLWQSVLIPSGVTQVVAGGHGSQNWFEAVQADGSVSAWGSNCYYALGIGYSPYCNQAPARVPISGATAVAAGVDHTLFLTTGGVYGVGDNYNGDLGNTGLSGGPVYNIYPVQNLTGVTAIAAGGTSSYALKSDGTVWAWGDDSRGQLGNGHADASTYNVPAQVTGLSGVIAISANRFCGYALKSDGTVWAWGGGYLGALGNGTTTDSYTPVQVSGLTNVTALAPTVSANYELAVRSDGTLWGWGDNTNGMLGTGNTTGSSVPVQTKNLTGVVSAAAGSNSANALKSDGTVWSWGQNNKGQLGNGTSANSYVPTKVFGIHGAQGVAAGGWTQATIADVPDPGPLSSYERYGGSNPSEYCARCAQGSAGDPVNTADGDFSETYHDLKIPGRGVALDFTHTYSSFTAATDGPLGHGWTYSYGMSLTSDPNSGEVTISQENGSQVRFTPNGAAYTAPARVMATLVHNGDGTWTFTRHARTKFTFDSGGRLTAETDLNNYTTTVAYPDASTQVVTDPAGRRLTASFSSGRIASVTDSASPSRSVQFAYDGNGDLTGVTDADGGVTQFTYDPSHQMTTVRQPKYAGDTTTTPSPVLTNQYDAAGRVTAQTDQVGRTTTFDYTSIANATKITDPKGNVTLDRYKNGVRTSSTHGYGSSKPATWKYYYDADTYGETASCDPKGHCGTFAYDAQGNLLSSTDALGRSTTYTYDGRNDVTSVTDAKNVTTSMTYDAAGNILTRSRPLLDASGATIATQKTTYNYGGTTPNYAGDVTSMLDPNGKTWQYRYDAYGDRISTTAPPTPENASGNKTTYAYDTGTGRQTSVTTPKGNVTGGNPAAFTTTYSYDAVGNVTLVRDPLWSSSAPTKHQTTFHYDANQNLDYQIDANGNKTSYTFDPANELTQTSRPDGITTRRDYWPDGTLHDRYDGKNAATVYTYDPLAHLATKTDPLGRVTTFTYDAVGNLTTRISPGGSCSTSPLAGCAQYTYDAADEPTGKSFADGKTPAVSAMTYDADGQRTGMTDASGTSTWTWDSLHRLTTTKDGFGNQVGYGYDLNGNLTSLNYPGNLSVTRDFDAAGRMDWVQDWKANKTTFGYDANSNVVTETLPTGTGVVDQYSYDNADGQLGITSKKGTTTLAGFTYTRDGAEQVATSTTSGITEAAQAYAYTPLEQLKTSGPTTAPVSYAYDAGDNLTARGNASTLSYDAGNQLCWQAASTVSNPSCGTVPTGATTFTYDGNGNRTKSTTGSTSTAYAFDEANRLTGYGTTVTYTYDGDSLRLAKTVSGTAQHFVWDHVTNTPQLLADATNKYVYGPNDLPLEQVNGTTVTWLHHDQLGSTRLLTSSTGANVGSYTYDPYGKTATKTGTVATPLEYAGQYTDSESGFVYMRARYYDPATGQFLSRDPLEDQTQQAYSYASGNPVNVTDPTGLCGAGSVGDILDSVNPFSDQNCAYQAADWAYHHPAIVATAVACGTPGIDEFACGPALAYNFGHATGHVIREGIDTGWRDPANLAAQEGVNVALLCFGAGSYAAGPLAEAASPGGVPLIGQMALRVPPTVTAAGADAASAYAEAHSRP